MEDRAAKTNRGFAIAKEASEQPAARSGVIRNARSRSKVLVVRFVIPRSVVRRPSQTIAHDWNRANPAYALGSGIQPGSKIGVLIDGRNGLEAIYLVRDGMDEVAQPIRYGQIGAQRS